MAQPVTAIMSRSDELQATARRHVGDANEAGLLVGKVFSRAFRKFDASESEEVIAATMSRDLQKLIKQRLQAM